jgi:hypothetical protein
MALVLKNRFYVSDPILYAEHINLVKKEILDLDI